MQSQILSLNIGHPQTLEWNGKSIKTSMLKQPFAGPLVVGPTSIEGDSFANPNFHGTPESVLYIFGLKSANEYIHLLGREVYTPGALGENITVDDFDEKQISVGDVFKIGDVLAQATFPRIPCAKVNVRMEHELGMKLMQQSGRSGVYMRILKPGRISMKDAVVRVEQPKTTFLIADVYRKMVNNEVWDHSDFELMDRNGFFAKDITEKLKAKFGNPLPANH